MKASRSTVVKGSTLLTATLGLGLGFVAMPSVTTGMSAPSTAPATNSPVTPQIATHALATAATASVAQSGPKTQVDKDTAATDVNGKPAVVPGKPTLDPSLQAGKSDADTVVSLPATGDMVGVTWPAGTPVAAKATVAVRARTADGWQDWQEMSIDPVLDQTTNQVKKYGTEAVWVDGAKEVQVRVAPQAKALLKTATLATVTTPQTQADSQLTPGAVPGAANAAYVPSYITRAGWGANEKLRKGCVPTINPTTQVVIVHHTAGSNSYTKAQSASILRGLLSYDTQQLGWCDIAYNMIVDKYGQKFEGRFGGLNKPVKGAHADSFNTRTFGISIMGNYDTTTVPAAGMEALAEGIAMRIGQFYINPYGKTTMYSEYNGTTSKYKKGAAYLANNIAGHRDSSNTICPGRYLYPRLGELRARAASLAGWNGKTYASAIYKRWIALGGAAKVGYVSVGEGTVSPGLQRTVFTGGKRIYNGAGGTRVVGTGIDFTYWGNGGATRNGQPSSDETAAVDGTYFTTTSGAVVGRSGSKGGVLSGTFLSAWLRTGGSRSTTLGTVTTPVGTVRGGTAQAFSRGSVYAATGQAGHAVAGGIRSAYNAVGSSNSALGLPTSDEFSWQGGIRQNFQGGYITWVAGQGTQVHYS